MPRLSRHPHRPLPPALIALALAVSAVAQPAALPAADRTAEWLAILETAADPAARARALQQLAVEGDSRAVPVLAGLLADDRLGQYARDVLEQLPDESAAAALRDALGRLHGAPLIGVVNSLGVRRDTRAVPELARLATSPGSPAAAPAMQALGRIATPAARDTVADALRHSSAEIRASAAEAAVLIADMDRRAGRIAAARALFDTVHRSDVPPARRSAALRGLLLTAGTEGVKLLMEQLHSEDPDARDTALRTARDVSDPNLTVSLAAEIDSFSPALQAAVITVLADRAEPGALAAVESRANSPLEIVRLAALRALGRIGRDSSVPSLIHAARPPATEAVTEAALAALTRIDAPSVADTILRVLGESPPRELRTRLIGVLGERRATIALPDLLRFAEGGDEEVAKAAWRALGLAGRPDDLPRMIVSALSIGAEETRALADRAIVTTAMKVTEPSLRFSAVLAAFREATDASRRAALLRPLGAIVRVTGGSHEVFHHVRAALTDSATEVRRAALACLADWPDATPTTALLELAADGKLTPEERESALRGALRMAGRVASGAERSPLNVLEAFATADRTARTKEERMLVVAGLGGVRAVDAIRRLEPYLDDGDVGAAAALAVVQVASALADPKALAAIRPTLERIAARDGDADIRRRATRLSRGEAPPVKGKGTKSYGKAGSGATASSPSGRLFNGRDLGDWDGDPGVWRVRDGVIVGGTLLGNPRNEFLATRLSFSNFVLRLEYRLTGTEGFVNGGVQVRSIRLREPPNEMSGYQADIGAGHSGSLYDESRRKRFLARAPAEQIARLERKDDWNTYEIRCEGPRVEISLNGEKTITYMETDSSVVPEGLIALQIHGNCRAEIAFRNLYLEKLP